MRGRWHVLCLPNITSVGCRRNQNKIVGGSHRPGGGQHGDMARRLPCRCPHVGHAAKTHISTTSDSKPMLADASNQCSVRSMLGCCPDGVALTTLLDMSQPAKTARHHDDVHQMTVLGLPRLYPALAHTRFFPAAATAAISGQHSTTNWGASYSTEEQRALVCATRGPALGEPGSTQCELLRCGRAAAPALGAGCACGSRRRLRGAQYRVWVLERKAGSRSPRQPAPGAAGIVKKLQRRAGKAAAACPSGCRHANEPAVLLATSARRPGTERVAAALPASAAHRSSSLRPSMTFLYFAARCRVRKQASQSPQQRHFLRQHTLTAGWRATCSGTMLLQWHSQPTSFHSSLSLISGGSEADGMRCIR